MSGAPDSDPRPLIVHVVHRLATGGMENGVVNLVNTLPADKYRHAVVCITGFSSFRERIARADVEVFALDKREGHDLALNWRLWKLLRRLRPALVHTRNIGTMEYLAVAAAAGIARRVHGEHGRDMRDIDGSNRKYLMLRRALRPLVTRFVAVSRDLEQWLQRRVGVPAGRISRICNGVDVQRFVPRSGEARAGVHPDLGEEEFLIGTVGRLKAEKNQALLIDAYARLVRAPAAAGRAARLLIVGDGPDLPALRDQARQALPDDAVIFAGERDDVPEVLRALDVFVLPSKGEGISNTILEAMASGVPVVATRVGGNDELVGDDETGRLVPPDDPRSMAAALEEYLGDEERRRRHGLEARRRAEERFSIDVMARAYEALYDSLLARRSDPAAVARQRNQTT